MPFSYLTKNIATFANQVKHLVQSFLLKEDGFYLLLESGDKIILENSASDYAFQTKNTS